jgi:iron complex transport system ATP-binding protein
VAVKEEDMTALSLSCSGLTVALSRQTILENVSLKAECGGVYVLLGRNGAGKTTLLRALSGLIKPVKGHITVGDKTASSLSRKEFARYVCYLPQTHTAIFEYQVVDFVILGRTAHGSIFYQPTKKDKAMALQILAETGIEHLAYRPYSRLSSGERQLVMLARALMQDTPFLLLDEPTSNLDFNHQRKIMAKVTKLAHENNKAVLVSIHDPNTAIEYCDYMIVIHNKKVVKQINKKDAGFYNDVEAVMREIYDPSIQVMQISGYAFVR